MQNHKRGFTLIEMLATIAIIALLSLTFSASAASYEPIVLSEDERYAMNLFLSNFTEVGCDEVSRVFPYSPYGAGFVMTLWHAGFACVPFFKF